MRIARWPIALAALLAALGAGWWFGSPWWTLRQIKAAAEAHDLDAISAYIDYPAMRADVSGQLRERLGGGVLELRGAERFLIGTMAEGLVDAVVRPEGLQAVLVAGSAARVPLNMRAEDMTVARDGIDRFRLVRKDGSGGALVFRRDGLGWKLAGVQVPRDFRLLGG